MGHGVVGVVVKAADSHVANCTIQVPDPGVEKHAGHMCMHAPHPERRMKNEGLRLVIPPRGLFLSFSLSLPEKCAHTITKTFKKSEQAKPCGASFIRH